MSTEAEDPSVHPRLAARIANVRRARLECFERSRGEALALLEGALDVLARYRASIGPAVAAPIETECLDVRSGLEGLQGSDPHVAVEAAALALRLRVVLGCLTHLADDRRQA